MKTLSFFIYKGHVGAISDIENGVFINDVKGPGQMGVVVGVEHIGMPREVKDFIVNNHVREGGSFAPVMITGGQMPSVAVLGFFKHLLTEDGKITISRDCDLKILDLIEEVPNVPEESFVEYLDSEVAQ